MVIIMGLIVVGRSVHGELFGRIKKAETIPNFRLEVKDA